MEVLNFKLRFSGGSRIRLRGASPLERFQRALEKGDCTESAMTAASRNTGLAKESRERFEFAEAKHRRGALRRGPGLFLQAARIKLH